MNESLAKLAVRLVETQAELEETQKQCNGLVKIILALKSGEITLDKVDIKGNF